MQDKIERHITIKASKERVYEAITDKQQITTWFPGAVEGEIATGEQPVFDFGDDGQTRLYVEAMQPHEYFAFRWVPGSAHFMGDVLSQTTTLVEFKITETDGVSTVTLTESGFASLPGDLAQSSFQDNTGGWGYMMDRLEQKFSEAN